MRKARTIGRKADGSEVILHNASIPADKQRTEFNNLGDIWPKDIVEVEFCPGPFKTKYRDKAKNVAKQIKDAEKRAADKLENAAKFHAEALAKIQAEADAKAKVEAEANAKIIAAKEASKAAAAANKKPATK